MRVWKSIIMPKQPLAQHVDVNDTDKPIEVIVVELKNDK